MCTEGESLSRSGLVFLESTRRNRSDQFNSPRKIHECGRSPYRRSTKTALPQLGTSHALLGESRLRCPCRSMDGPPKSRGAGTT